MLHCDYFCVFVSWSWRKWPKKKTGLDLMLQKKLPVPDKLYAFCLREHCTFAGLRFISLFLAMYFQVRIIMVFTIAMVLRDLFQMMPQ